MIMILSILGATLLPLFQKGAESARRTVCANNLRQHHLGASCYADENKGMLPTYPQMDGSAITDDYMCANVNIPGWSGATGWYLFGDLGYIDTATYDCPSSSIAKFQGLHSGEMISKGYAPLTYGFRYNSLRTIAYSYDMNDKRTAYIALFPNDRPHALSHVRRTFTSPYRTRWSLFVDHWTPYWVPPTTVTAASRANRHGGIAQVIRVDGIVKLLPSYDIGPYNIMLYDLRIDPYIKN